MKSGVGGCPGDLILGGDASQKRHVSEVIHLEGAEIRGGRN